MATTHAVAIQNMGFEPNNVSLETGDTVEWTNRMGMAHTVTPDKDEFPGSGSLSPDETFSHLFDAAGTVNYHCEIHPFMTGSVTVAAAAPQTGGGELGEPKKAW
jgi:plastocyanin